MKTYFEGPAVDDPDWAATGAVPDVARCVRVETGDSLLVKIEFRDANGKVVYGAGEANLSPVFVLTDSSGPQPVRTVNSSPFAALATLERRVVRFESMPAGLVTPRAWAVAAGGAPRMALQMEVVRHA